MRHAVADLIERLDEKEDLVGTENSDGGAACRVWPVPGKRYFGRGDVVSPLLLWLHRRIPSPQVCRQRIRTALRKPTLGGAGSPPTVFCRYRTADTNQPDSRQNQFRVFDFKLDNEPQLDAAQLVIQRAIEKPNQFGFRFNLIAGSGVPEVTAAYGLFRNCHTGIAHHVDIPELYLSYTAPLGKGLRFDAGKFATHMGSALAGNDFIALGKTHTRSWNSNLRSRGDA